MLRKNVELFTPFSHISTDILENNSHTIYLDSKSHFKTPQAKKFDRKISLWLLKLFQLDLGKTEKLLNTQKKVVYFNFLAIVNNNNNNRDGERGYREYSIFLQFLFSARVSFWNALNCAEISHIRGRRKACLSGNKINKFNISYEYSQLLVRWKLFLKKKAGKKSREFSESFPHKFSIVHVSLFLFHAFFLLDLLVHFQKIILYYIIYKEKKGGVYSN